MKIEYALGARAVLEVDLPEVWTIVDSCQWSSADPRKDALVAVQEAETLDESNKCALFVKLYSLEAGKSSKSFIDEKMKRRCPYEDGFVPDEQILIGGKHGDVYDWTDGVAEIRTIYVSLNQADLVEIEWSWADLATVREVGFGISRDDALALLARVTATISWS